MRKTKKTVSLVLTLLMVISVFAVCLTMSATAEPFTDAEAGVDPFDDVPGTAWYREGALFCKLNGYMSGTADFFFGAGSNLTRAQIAVIFSVIANVDTDKYAATPTAFTDVKAGSWYEKAVKWMVAQKMTAGITPTTFCPNNVIDRSQLCLFVMKLSEYLGKVVSQRADLSKFTDAVKIPAWAREGVSYAVAIGITAGYPDGRFGPAEKVTRAQMAVITKAYVLNVYKGDHKHLLTEPTCTEGSRCTVCGVMMDYPFGHECDVCVNGGVCARCGKYIAPVGHSFRVDGGKKVCRRCGDTVAIPVKPEKPIPIKIGGIGPITGPAAIYGRSVRAGIELAVEEINSLGGSVTFELKFVDDEHVPEKSVRAYNALKDWGMQILVGTVTTTPCIAVSEESYKDRIFMLTPSASSIEVIGGQPDVNGNVTVARKDNVFQMCFTDQNQGSASAQYIFTKKLASKVAVIYQNDDAYSTGIYQKFQKQADELGLEIVSVTTFTADSATDFTSQLNSAKAGGADLLFLPIYYTPASRILTQADRMGYIVKVFGVDGMDGILTVENFDTSLAEGIMLLTPFIADAKDELTVKFVKNYQEKTTFFEENPNQFTADAYDCVYALYYACIENGINGNMTAADICETLIGAFTGGFSFDGLTGTGITWSDTGEVSKAPKAMIIINGKYVGM